HCGRPREIPRVAAIEVLRPFGHMLEEAVVRPSAIVGVVVPGEPAGRHEREAGIDERAARRREQPLERGEVALALVVGGRSALLPGGLAQAGRPRAPAGLLLFSVL